MWSSPVTCQEFLFLFIPSPLKLVPLHQNRWRLKAFRFLPKPFWRSPLTPCPQMFMSSQNRDKSFRWEWHRGSTSCTERCEGKKSPLCCVSDQGWSTPGTDVGMGQVWFHSMFLSSWGRLCGELTAACSCSGCIIHDNKVPKAIFLGVHPCCSLLEEPTGAPGAGHTYGQTFSWNPDPQLNGSRGTSRWEGCCGPTWPNTISIPFYLPPSRGRLLLGNPASLHPCTTAALQSCCSPAAPPLPQAWGQPCSHVLPAACKQRYHLPFSAWKQVGARKMKMWRMLLMAWGMENSALPDAFLVLTLARGVLAPNSSVLVLFMWLLLPVSHWHPEQVIEISIWLRTRDNLLPT